MPQIASFSNVRLIPVFDSEDAHQVNVALAPGVYASGTVLGEITSAAVNDVQTITSTLSGGSFKMILPLQGGPLITAAAAYNATGATYAANIQTALNNAIQTIYPTGSAVVTGTGPFVVTFSGGPLAGQNIPIMSIDNSLATGGTATVAHTTPGIGPFGAKKAYASGNTDGSQVAIGLLEYPCVVDNAGNISIGAQLASEFGQTELVISMFYNGDFAAADLVGLDAAGLANMSGRLISGSITTGIVHIG